MFEQTGVPPWVWAAVLGLALAISIFRALAFAFRRMERGTQQKARNQERIKTSGASAQATILEATDAGVRIGIMYVVVQLRLAIEAVDGVAAFETTLDVPISPVRMIDFAEGRTVRVRVDRETREVAIDQRTH